MPFNKLLSLAVSRTWLLHGPGVHGVKRGVRGLLAARTNVVFCSGICLPRPTQLLHDDIPRTDARYSGGGVACVKRFGRSRVCDVTQDFFLQGMYTNCVYCIAYARAYFRVKSNCLDASSVKTGSASIRDQVCMKMYIYPSWQADRKEAGGPRHVSI